ncbi:TetR/AcrR family transcriptional regulator [Microlunatus speluncae]|uniref:TetR/AcrR family transcriptional regulator n=1 Tax=Microlunatus speluncae TaxID=2594267 RepID=UPI00126646A5|nr:TetR/AcrR family transcriptional regulator [Microlunatus speluncae]
MSGTQARPGGRTARNTRAIFDALFVELVDGGLAGLTFEAIATRAGVHKSTLYRRWPTTDLLLAAALTEHPRNDWTPPRTGDLERDLIGVGRAVLDGLDDPQLGPISRACIAAAFDSVPAAEALAAFFDDQHRRAAVVITDAIDRGDLPPGTDPGDLLERLLAPLYYRRLITHRPVTQADLTATARRLVRTE